MVRKKEEYSTLSVPIALKRQLEKDKAQFQRLEDGGTLSLADVIIKYRAGLRDHDITVNELGEYEYKISE